MAAAVVSQAARNLTITLMLKRRAVQLISIPETVGIDTDSTSQHTKKKQKLTISTCMDLAAITITMKQPTSINMSRSSMSMGLAATIATITTTKR